MRQATQSIAIFGAGGHGRVVAELAILLGYEIVCFLADEITEPFVLGIPVLREVPVNWGSPNLAIAIGDNVTRESIFLGLSQKINNGIYPSLIHPRAMVSPSANIESGTVVFAGAIIGPQANIGRFAIINHGAQIDHNSKLCDFSSLGPGAVLGGDVTLGKAAVVAISAVVKHGVEIGDHSILGANSYLDKSLPPNIVSYGNPAQFVRMRQKDESYL